MSRFLPSVLALLVGLSLIGPVQAGKYNKKVSIGDAAPSYTGLPGTDGKTHSLADLKGKEVVVIAVTCNHCPVAVAYEDRIVELTRKVAGDPKSKVAVVAINVNTLEADRLDKMTERAKAKGFNFPYLFDESQQIGRALGATVTPEFFVLDKERKIVYMGAMDDAMKPASVKHRYVEDAVKALLAGEKVPTSETRARGCGVKYERK